MGLNSRAAIDPRWLTHNMSVGYGLQLANVQVYNPSSQSQEYDPETNTWTGSTVVLYEGPARVQPINAVFENSDTYNPTFIKTVRVQIPYYKNEVEGATAPVPDIRPNDRMLVNSAPYNTTLEKFIYTVVDILNSSNAWERTIICRVDTELDPTNTVELPEDGE
jgi:hypothetical protein